MADSYCCNVRLSQIKTKIILAAEKKNWLTNIDAALQNKCSRGVKHTEYFH
jgi:hypothetical protein